MPFKSRRQKENATKRRASFDIVSSSFKWEGEATSNVQREDRSGLVKLDDTARMKKDLTTILIICTIIIAAQVALSLTLL